MPQRSVRAEIVPIGAEPTPIDARAQCYPDERRYVYRPFATREDEFRFNDATFERVIRDYTTKDLAI